MLAWSTLQDALSEWMADTSGLTAATFGFDGPPDAGLDDPNGFGTSPVIWAFQKAPQPKLPYAMLKLHPPRKVGGLDELNISSNATSDDGFTFDLPEDFGGTGDAAPGQEITQTVTGIRELTLTIEVFSTSVTGAGTAMEYLENALTSLRLPSQLYNLQQAGLSLVDWETPVDLSAIVSDAYQSRAQADVRFYVVDSVSETTGYIATVDVTPTIDDHTYPELVIAVA